MTEGNPSSFTQLIYVSAQTCDFTLNDLRELLEKARDNNNSKDITGMLVYHDHSFLQVLEGEDKAVSDLFEHIEKDPRHNNIKILFRDNVPSKEFEQWSMGFVNTSRYPLDTDGFVDFNQIPILAINLSRAKKVLRLFQQGVWHQRAH